MDTAVATFEQAGQVAARQALRQLGRPIAMSWFHANAPASPEEALPNTGKPMEFWQGMWTELASVAGTA